MTLPAGGVGWVVHALGTSFAAGTVAFVIVAIGARLFRRPEVIRLVLSRSLWPLVLVSATVAFRVAVVDIPATGTAAIVARQSAGVAVAIAATWAVVRWIQVAEARLLARFDVSVRDNRRARQVVTQVQVLRRVATVIAVVIGVIVALRSTEWGRDLGTSLLASAGILGAILGFAGRSTLGNLLAGIQIAMTGRIRLDDAVVVEGEWGNVEEITLTYVVVRTWDRRRLVLPTTQFVEQPFENWTRSSAELLGVVELWVDYTTPMEGMRAELERLVERSARWNGKVVVLQVTDAIPQSLKVRALVSADDAPTTFDLRCEIREGLARWLAAHHPSSLPKVRVEDGSNPGGERGAAAPAADRSPP